MCDDKSKGGEWAVQTYILLAPGCKDQPFLHRRVSGFQPEVDTFSPLAHIHVVCKVRNECKTYLDICQPAVYKYQVKLHNVAASIHANRQVHYLRQYVFT